MDKRKILTLIVLCLWSVAGFCQTPLEAMLESDTIALGDQTVLTIGPADRYPSTEQLSQGGVLALSQEFDTATNRLKTVLTSFEPGEHWIHLTPDDSLLLIVTDVEVDTTSTEIRDIAGLEKIPYTFWEIFRWILLAIGILAIGFAIWWFVTHRQRMQQILGLSEPVDTRNPYERAMDSIKALRDQKMWQSDHVKEYYTELTDIVRRFIEESTDIRATDMTSEETIEAVGAMGDTAELRELFTLADLVKFAKREPLPHEHESALDKASSYVEMLWAKVKPTETDEPKEEEGHDA